MLGRFLFLLFFAVSLFPLQSAETYTVKGRIIGKLSRNRFLMPEFLFSGIRGKHFFRFLGFFSIRQVPPGVYRLSTSCIGYKNLLTEEYIVSAKLPFIELEMEEDETQLEWGYRTVHLFRV